MKEVRSWLESSKTRPDGSTASIITKWAALEVGVEKTLAQNASELISQGDTVMVIRDRRTLFLSESVEKALVDKGFKVQTYQVPNQHHGHPPSADDIQVEALHKELQKSGATLTVAIGSGTNNDIAKAATHPLKMPYFSYGTAASMNGYTSNIAALYVKGLKATVPVTPPIGVYADPEIVANAPRALTLAGLGDLCSKPFAGADATIAAHLQKTTPWRLPMNMVEEIFQQTLDNAEKIGQNDPQSLVGLMKALWISGFSMALAGSSAPASGGEHLWSHRLDMLRHDQGKAPMGLHGTQVGIACGLVRELFAKSSEVSHEEVRERLSQPIPEPDPNSDEFDEWLSSRHSQLSEGSLSAVRREAAKKYNREVRKNIRSRVAETWPEIQKELKQAKEHADRVDLALQRAKSPQVPVSIGLSKAESAHLLYVCRDIRDRLTILDLASDLGLLEKP